MSTFRGTGAPLLFDNNYKAKPAYYTVQSELTKADAGVGTIGEYIVNPVIKLYPNIHIQSPQTWGPIKSVKWIDEGINYSDGTRTRNADTRRVVRCLWDANYFINMAVVKKHESVAAVTLSGKNHFGSIKNCWDIHNTIDDRANGMASYNSLVDLVGHEKIGGKTILYLMDGLWAAPGISDQPRKWSMSPFNNDWPSSIFLSQDFVAIDSVALDFINAEWSLWANGDNYMHEAALANDPPSGTLYDPEKDGKRMRSLGVHEHWNNAQDKQYSRNLNTGEGIELVAVGDEPIVTPEPSEAPGAGLMGDVDGNGKVDIVDALVVARYSVGLNPSPFIVKNGDVNMDNKITIVDALLVARYYVGMIKEF